MWANCLVSKCLVTLLTLSGMIEKLKSEAKSGVSAEVGVLPCSVMEPCLLERRDASGAKTQFMNSRKRFMPAEPGFEPLPPTPPPELFLPPPPPDPSPAPFMASCTAICSRTQNMRRACQFRK